MEEARAIVAERRRQAEEDAKRAHEARLAKAKADLEAEKREGLRIIYADYTHAMRIGDFDKIYLLIDNYGADVNWEDTYGNTPLIAACRYGLRLPIRNLIERGADADYENKFGMTPLIEACKGGYSLLIPTLLFDEAKRPRCSVDLVNMYGKTAKDYAIESGHAIKIVPLLEAGVGDQKAALEAIFGTSKKPKKETFDRKKFMEDLKNNLKKKKENLIHIVMTPHRKFKKWHYKKYKEEGKKNISHLYAKYLSIGMPNANIYSIKPTTS